MNTKRYILTLCVILATTWTSFGQEKALKWQSASTFQVMGRVQDHETLPFQRLPEKMKPSLRSKVWELSQNSAGLYFDFHTDSPEIEMAYQVEGELAFPHMPATGVSGIDLYVMENDNEWQWARGNYHFGDTISYRYRNLKPKSGEPFKFFRVYLPLYNTVKWLKIGIESSASLKPVDAIAPTSPIVIYGTSIVQGACASRPGMTWSSILGRKLAVPVINLGFSGNGRLEKEIVDFMVQKKASVYILDCMANFTSGQGLSPKEAKKRLKKAVVDIRKKHPNTPILIAEHAGYSDGNVQSDRLHTYSELNRAVQQVYGELLKQEIDFVYLLKKEDLNLGIDSFVDGTHPNDYGMLQYAEAYFKKLKGLGLFKVE